MSVDVIIDTDLIFEKVTAANKEEVFHLLAEALIRKGLVQPAYKKAILDREIEYPTGLPSSAPAVAIPHADFNLVNRTAIAVASLVDPVLFQNMEDTKESLEVQIVVMLAIAEPHGQVEMLQRIITFIQSQDLREKVVASTSKEAILAILKETILKEREA